MQKYKIFGLILVILMGLFTSAHSKGVQFDSGIAWLNSNQNATGSWGNTPDSLTNEHFATTAALDALRATGQAASLAHQNGSLWLQSQTAPNTAYLAARIISLSSAGVDVAADTSLLLSYKNAKRARATG